MEPYRAAVGATIEQYGGRFIGPASLVGNSRETFHKSGTDGSNPVPSSAESANYRFRAGLPTLGSDRPHFRGDDEQPVRLAVVGSELGEELVVGDSGRRTNLTCFRTTCAPFFPRSREAGEFFCRGNPVTRNRSLQSLIPAFRGTVVREGDNPIRGAIANIANIVGGGLDAIKSRLLK